MSKQKLGAIIGSHIGVLLLGAFLVRGTFVETGSEREASDEEEVVRFHGGAQAADKRQTSKVSLRSLSPNSYAELWSGLAGKGLIRDERRKLQQKILADWAKVNLEGALRAALEVKADTSKWYGHALFHGEFGKVFKERPDEIWEIMESGSLGLDTGLVRNRLLDVMGRENPKWVIERIEGMGMFSRGMAVKELFSGGWSIEKRRELMKELEALPEGVMTLALWKRAMPKHQVKRIAIKELQEDLAKNMGGELEGLHLRNLAIGSNELPVEELLKTADAVPEELRGQFAKELFEQQNWSDIGENTLPTLDLLMETEQWETLESDNAIRKVQRLATETEDPAGLATWAVGLPEREEAKALFKRGVWKYIRDNMDDAKAWISDFPNESWKKDLALGEYSQQALWAHGNPKESEWAIGQIGDPVIQEEVQGWEARWRRQQGGK